MIDHDILSRKPTVARTLMLRYGHTYLHWLCGTHMQSHVWLVGRWGRPNPQKVPEVILD